MILGIAVLDGDLKKKKILLPVFLLYFIIKARDPPRGTPRAECTLYSPLSMTLVSQQET